MTKVKHEAGPIKGSTRPTKPSAYSWGAHKIKERFTTYLWETNVWGNSRRNCKGACIAESNRMCKKGILSKLPLAGETPPV
eukprot:1641198-Heterocapsa_arctica.AAC.1